MLIGGGKVKNAHFVTGFDDTEGTASTKLSQTPAPCVAAKNEHHRIQHGPIENLKQEEQFRVANRACRSVIINNTIAAAWAPALAPAVCPCRRRQLLLLLLPLLRGHRCSDAQHVL